MTRNTRQLSADDRLAIDLLLDQGSSHHTSATHATRGVAPARVAAAARLLATLEAMSAVQPPGDLVSRTLARVEGATRPLIAVGESGRAIISR